MHYLSKFAILLIAAGCFFYATSAHAHGTHFRASSTAYTPCSAGQIMADGSRVRFHSVANNWLPLGTKIRLIGRGPYGARRFWVRDRIGYGSQLDFWVPSCSYAFHWGRRIVRFHVVR